MKELAVEVIATSSSIHSSISSFLINSTFRIWISEDDFNELHLQCSRL